jgi:hypothetical protein
MVRTWHNGVLKVHAPDENLQPSWDALLDIANAFLVK